MVVSVECVNQNMWFSRKIHSYIASYVVMHWYAIIMYHSVIDLYLHM